MAFISCIPLRHLKRCNDCRISRSLFLRARSVPLPRMIKNHRLRKFVPLHMELQADDKKHLQRSVNSAQANDDNGSGVVMERYAVGALYIFFAASVLVFGPGTLGDPGQFGMILAGKLEDVNDIFFAIFNLFGATSVVLAAILNAGAPRQQKLRTDLFSLSGLFLGFWAFGPYLVARQYVPQVHLEEVLDRGVLSRILESKTLALATILYAVWAYSFALGLFTPGTIEYHDVLLYAAVTDLVRVFSQDRGVFSTCVDFLIMNTIIWGPLTEDMSRRGWFKNGRYIESTLTALSFVLIPVVGPAVYLLLRPSLPANTPKQS